MFSPSPGSQKCDASSSPKVNSLLSGIGSWVEDRILVVEKENLIKYLTVGGVSSNRSEWTRRESGDWSHPLLDRSKDTLRVPLWSQKTEGTAEWKVTWSFELKRRIRSRV